MNNYYRAPQLWRIAGLLGLVSTFLMTSLVTTSHAARGIAEKRISRSVIKIVNYSQSWEWANPWKPRRVSRSSGTGFVVAGNRIMTNAHVVSWQRRLELKKHNDPKHYWADVEFVAHECDLAIIKPRDPDFFKGLSPLPIGKLPKMRSVVTTYGYPAGGKSLSSTKGVVSRIEHNTYVHPGSVMFLTVQTDAAINPGNSGGPVIQNGRVAGVAFQGIGSLDNVGFFIPADIIQHFLEDIKDGSYDGFPDLYVRYSHLENEAYRAYLKLPEKLSGVIVDSIIPGAPAGQVLKQGDIITHLAGRDVANDGTVMYKSHRIIFAIGVDAAQVGDEVPLRIWRDGKALKVKVKVNRDGKRYDRTSNMYDRPPRYYIYAGMVFMPLSREYLKLWGRSWAQGADTELLYQFWEYAMRYPDKERSETIVMRKILTSTVNANLNYRSNMVVDTVNGIRIESLQDMEKAFAKPVSRHVINYTEHNAVDVLDKAAAEEEHGKILEQYGITRDRNFQ